MSGGSMLWLVESLINSRGPVSHLLRALETFQALGVDFVNLTVGVDTSTPTAKMIFTVLAAIAELESNLIAESLLAGIRNPGPKATNWASPFNRFSLLQIAKRREGLLER